MKNGFIAYDKKSKRFILSYHFAVNSKGDVYMHESSEGYTRKVSNIEILDYSGKNDRNGTKLYKGDIVKVELDESDGQTPPWYEDIPAKTIIGVVVIRPSEGARILIKKVIPEGAAGITKGRTLRIKQDRDIRIGHVYTKPELLEEEVAK